MLGEEPVLPCQVDGEFEGRGAQERQAAKEVSLGHGDEAFGDHAGVPGVHSGLEGAFGPHRRLVVPAGMKK